MNQPKIVLICLGAYPCYVVQNAAPNHIFPDNLDIPHFLVQPDYVNIYQFCAGLNARSTHGDHYIIIHDANDELLAQKEQLVSSLIASGETSIYAVLVSESIDKDFANSATYRSGDPLQSINEICDGIKQVEQHIKEFQDKQLKESEMQSNKIKTTHLIFIGDELEKEINTGALPLAKLVDELTARGGRLFSFKMKDYLHDVNSFMEVVKTHHHPDSNYLIFFYTDPLISNQTASWVWSAMTNAGNSARMIPITPLPSPYGSTAPRIMYDSIYESMLPGTPPPLPHSLQKERIDGLVSIYCDLHIRRIFARR